MAPGRSKTARRSTPKMGKALTDADKVTLAASSPVRRVIPLNDGRHCYLADPTTGRNRHLATDSAEFDDLVAKLADLGLRARLTAEVTEYATCWPDSAWPGVLARLTGANGALVDPAAPTGADPD